MVLSHAFLGRESEFPGRGRYVWYLYQVALSMYLLFVLYRESGTASEIPEYHTIRALQTCCFDGS
jgi:hypothetical protein